jgi:hypothetical protein
LIGIALSAVYLLCTANLCGGQNAAPIVSEETAHALAVSTLTASAQRLSGRRFDREKARHPEGFYWFEVTANVPDDESPLLGYFAVNKTTGDVWDSAQCRKLTSPAIRHFQEQLLQSGTISEAELHRREKLVPCKP